MTALIACSEIASDSSSASLSRRLPTYVLNEGVPIFAAFTNTCIQTQLPYDSH